MEWADPRGTAIPGQPVAGQMQAPSSGRNSKINLTYWASIEAVPDVKLIRTDTTL